MAQTPYDTGGGGGTSSTDTGICSITPSDLVGYTGNALNRIKELEQRVAELEAKLVKVNQLSDLSQQVGWVGGVEYMGVSGWTQTEYGTLIPPPGVSLSSLGITIPNVGSAMQFMVVDENGDLVLGADLFGQLFGSKIDQWNGATAPPPDYIRVEYNNSLSGPSAGNLTASRGSIWTTNTLSSTEIKITTSEAGFYLINASASMGFASPPSSFLGGLAVLASNDPSYDSPEELYRDYIVTAAGGGVSEVSPSVSRQVYFAAGGFLRAVIASTGSPHIQFLKVNIVRIGS